MTLPLTITAQLTALQINLQPQIVLCIDGIDTKFAATEILEYIRIGDPGLLIDSYNGAPWYIGGLRAVSDQLPVISFQSGTTTKINQQLQPDKGLGTSVTQLTVAMVDLDQQVTNIISPGFVVDDVLGKNCKVMIGFANNAFPQDYFTVFRGIVETIQAGPGLIKFNLTSTEQKKRQTLLDGGTGKLTNAIAGSGAITVIDVDDTSMFRVPVNGPGGTPDTSVTYYAIIGEEWFSYTGKTGTQLTGVTRNPTPFNFGETAHDPDDDIQPVVRVQGSGLDIVRKMMLSGTNGYFQTGVEIENFVNITPLTLVTNSIFFLNVDVEEEYGLTVGDYIETTGASNGANNVTGKTITNIVQTTDGSYIEIDGVAFVPELGTAAVIKFRSQWDTYGWGCSMVPKDVDLPEFENIYRTFLSGFNFDFRIKNSFEAKDLIENQILRPMTAFSIMRKGQVSLGIHTAPLPTTNMITVDQTNTENAGKISINRSLSKNFYNLITYALDKDPQTDTYKSTVSNTDGTSVTDFKLVREIKFNSDGLRTDNGGLTVASTSSQRLLNRYKRGAEYIDQIEVNFGQAIAAEIGDNIILDFADLQISDTLTGTRNGDKRIVQILNKSIDLKTGKIVIGVTDTKFDGSARLGLISPSSNIRAGATTQVFVIESSHSSVFGVNEFLKWTRFGRTFVRVRSDDGTRNEVGQIDTFNGNTITLVAPLSFAPLAGDMMEFPPYNQLNEQQKLTYVAMRNTGPFDDGADLYKML